MKIYTEFIILHKNIGFPSEDDFCPYIWESEYFDSDGDYYFYNIGDQWTNLDLAAFDEGKEAEFELATYRGNSTFHHDTHELKRYIEQFLSESWYAQTMNRLPTVFEELAASSIVISAKNLEMYRKLLETVHFFLEYTQGYLWGHAFIGAEEFKKEFLDN